MTPWTRVILQTLVLIRIKLWIILNVFLDLGWTRVILQTLVLIRILLWLILNIFQDLGWVEMYQWRNIFFVCPIYIHIYIYIYIGNTKYMQFWIFMLILFWILVYVLLLDGDFFFFLILWPLQDEILIPTRQKS